MLRQMQHIQHAGADPTAEELRFSTADLLQALKVQTASVMPGVTYSQHSILLFTHCRSDLPLPIILCETAPDAFCLQQRPEAEAKISAVYDERSLTMLNMLSQLDRVHCYCHCY